MTDRLSVETSASRQDPAALLAAYHAALDRLDFQALKKMFAPDAVYVSAGVGSLKGRAQIIAAFRDYFDINEHRESVDTQIVALDAASARSHWRLTAFDRTTGQTVRRQGIETIWFRADGRIVSIIVEDSGA